MAAVSEINALLCSRTKLTVVLRNRKVRDEVV